MRAFPPCVGPITARLAHGESSFGGGWGQLKDVRALFFLCLALVAGRLSSFRLMNVKRGRGLFLYFCTHTGRPRRRVERRQE